MANHASESTHHHILPLRIYFSVAGALFVLTAITVWVSYYHFGAFNLLVAMVIAATKATLVIMFFMHLKYDNKLYTLIFVAAIAFFATFVFLTMADTMERGEIYEYKQGPIHKEAPMYDSLRANPPAAHEGGEHEATADSAATEMNPATGDSAAATSESSH
jgi:cytochrome c oxidase subunit 4